MTKILGEDPIAPIGTEQELLSDGMSIRSYLACHILNGLLSKHGSPDHVIYRSELPRSEPTPGTLSIAAEMRQVAAMNRHAITDEAVALADALIAALNEDHE